MDVDRILRRAASGDFAHYRPQWVVEAVNALWPLGKDGALAAIESYLASQNLEVEPQEGLLLVLRVLLEVPAESGNQRPLRLGASSPPPPPKPESLPLFPLVLIDDLPLMMVSGFALGGDTEPVAAHLAHYRANGNLRSRPLAPSGSKHGALDQYRAIYKRAYGTPPPQRELDFIEAQLSGVHSPQER